MWRNYLAVGFRSLTKNKTYAFINVFGLALGLAASMMILLYVRYETTYDHDLPGVERAFQLQTLRQNEDGSQIQMNMAPFPAKAALVKDFPQVEKAVYDFPGSPIVLQNGEATSAPNTHFVDGPLFDILQFPFIEGDAGTALREPGSIVLTRAEAAKRFPDGSALGQTLTLVSQGRSADYRVTGIIEDIPKNSHFSGNMIARYVPEDPGSSGWNWLNGRIYVTLKVGTDAEVINSQLPAWEKRNIPTVTLGNEQLNAGDESDFRLVNARNLHIGESGESERYRENRRTILTLGAIAALMLFMACANFTNLATARAGQRAREVAMRKILGATKKQLIAQFIGESILVAALAMVIALAFVELALPYFANFLDEDLKLTYFGPNGLLPGILALVLLVGAAGGLYPAFFLSRFQPAKVLKANKSSTDSQGAGRLRTVLVVFQFAISIGLIACTAIIYSQTVFARSADPGYQRDGLLQVDNIGRRQLRPSIDTLVSEISKVEGVASASRTGIGIAPPMTIATGAIVPGQDEAVSVGTYSADPLFFSTMGVKTLAGRTFDPSRPMDEVLDTSAGDEAANGALLARGINVVANELAIKNLGFVDPAAAVGKQVGLNMPELGGVLPATIIGVVADARVRSVREASEPILFFNDPTGFSQLVVRYRDANPAALRDRIEAVWKRIAHDIPFEAEFSEQIVEELYGAEEARAQAFAIFALLAVVVACLGLFGMAAFTAERRTREIGIRKVLGATSRDIVQLLAWQFSKPVIVANLVAWPVAWWAMRDWLNTFDSRIDLGPGPFVLAGAIALAIAIGTIASHALKVARANPIHALRYE